MTVITSQLQSKIQFHIVTMDSAIEAAPGYYRNRRSDDNYIKACGALVDCIKSEFGSVANFSKLYEGSVTPDPEHDVVDQAAIIAFHFRRPILMA